MDIIEQCRSIAAFHDAELCDDVLTSAANEIERLRAKLSNLSNAAAIVYAAFKPISGPDETAKALLKMELGLRDEG